MEEEGAGVRWRVWRRERNSWEVEVWSREKGNKSDMESLEDREE